MGGNGYRADVVVVGGGLAGLAAAAYLGRAGKRVVLFDKADAIGGRARTKTVQGFQFNLGAHALYRAGRGIQVLRELGVAVGGGVPQISGAFALRAGRLHTLPVGFLSLLTSGLLTPVAKLELARLLAGVERDDTGPLQRITVADWLRERVASPSVRDLFAAILRVATYCDEPEHQSAGAALDQFRRGGQGVLYLHGGWQTLVDGLRRAAEAAGVRIVAHRGVAGVVLDDGVRGIRLEDGELVTAAAAVIAGSPRMAAQLCRLEPSSRWAEAAIPIYAACLDVALDRLPRPEARFALGIDQPLYASVHSAVARLAPAGGALIHLARYGGLRGRAAAAVEGELEAVLDALQPGWPGHVVHRRFVPDFVVSNAVATARGGGLAGRPGPDVPGVPGLYVAGDWVGPEGMLSDASLASARSAALAIVESERRAVA